MKNVLRVIRPFIFIIPFCLLLLSSEVFAEDTGELGPQSTQSFGEKKILIVVVKFRDAPSSIPIQRVKNRVVRGFKQYVSEQSYGLASIKTDFRGPVVLPDSLHRYRIEPYNFKVDKNRIRKLIEDTMTVIEIDVDFSSYDHMLIIPALHTTAGKGYGMICYCANPGMLSGVTKRYVPKYLTLASAGGNEFSGGVFVGTENAHLGMFAHDYFHALAGIEGDRRLVPCLYDFERQSDASRGLPSFEKHAIYMGFWDIMSQHFVERSEPPQGLSSFTKIRLGWIKKNQVQIVKPGDTLYTSLFPLSEGGERLVVKIPMDNGTYYLVENRQRVGYDKILPDSGILILKVHPDAPEGYGTVRVQFPDTSGDFTNATFKLREKKRNIFTDKANGISIIPLWKQKNRQGVLVTYPGDHTKDAIKAAEAIQALIDKDMEKEQVVVKKAIAAFKQSDYKASYAIAANEKE